MSYDVKHIINGQPTQSTDQIAIENPANGETIGQLSMADEAQTIQAINSAQVAFANWSQTPPQKRARILFRFKSLIEKYESDLATLVCQEHGKTLEDAKGSVARGIELIEFTCGMPYLLRGSYSENVAHDVDCYTVRQALGVCAGISPFNFPVMVPIWMFVPAIAYGNTFVLKPSEQAPSAPTRLIELLHDAGCPEGVVNILHGDKKTVDILCQHSDIKSVTAVASSQVAQSIYETATSHGKRAATFGGAKNHCVVMPDADINQTCEAIIGAAYGSAGERCMAISVVVAIGDQTADALIEHISKRLPDLVIGPGDQAKTSMGPLISAAHHKKVTEYISGGIEEGATLVVDGRQFAHPDYPNGHYLGPCLFDQVQPDMRIAKEEIFGPVLSVIRVNSLDDAITLVSQHPYGNGTAIFTHNGEAARYYASQVQVGMVGINIAIPVPIAYHSFGGWKASMYGDIAMHGDQSVQFYTKLKTITSRWPKDKAKAQFTMPTH